MDLHYLKLFHAAATEKNFTEAAKSLYMSQPALSMQVKRFERALGMRLFDKVGNRNVLNAQGQLLYSYTQKIFTIIEEANTALLESSEVIAGNLTIGGSNTVGIYILPKMIGIFKKLYPRVSVNLHVADTSEITRMALDNRFDFAINGGSVDYGPTIYCEKLREERLVLSAAPESALALKHAIKAEDLKSVTFISHEKQSQLYRLTERIIHEAKLPTEISMTFNNIDAIKQAVEADLGVSLIPFSAVRNELNLGLIREIFLGDASWSYPQSLIYNKHRHQSPASLKMMEIVRQTVAQFF